VRSQDPNDQQQFGDVRSGKREQISGLIETKVVMTINDLYTIDAWTLEHSMIGFMRQHLSSKTFNKCNKFGLGPMPKSDVTIQKYTVTLIRGTANHIGYRAYDNELPDKIHELLDVIKEGHAAQVRFV